jgi:hypothetical protein
VVKHATDVSCEEGVLGTTSEDHAPFVSRYWPTVAGVRFEPVVPSATHEPDWVHALTRRGTLMPMEGTPVT